MNVHYDDLERREVRWVVNGRDESYELSMWANLCDGECEVPEIEEEEEIVTNLMYWSDPNTWARHRERNYRTDEDGLPLDGEEVEIMVDMDVIYDIGTSPVFKNLQVNGKLSFKRSEPALLQAYSIWIRAGEVNVGTKEEPFDSTVEFKLHGNQESPSEFTFSASVPTSNKNLIVTGKLNMYGTPRTRMTRLLQSAYPNQNTLLVEPGLDYVNGDQLGLPATNVVVYSSETVTVESYDANSGLVTLTEPLKGYHFGQTESTGEDYSGVDMRGEVLLLTSNVNVTANTDSTSMTRNYPKPFGCQIIVADFFEPLDFKYRYGEIELDNIAVYGCSQ